MNSIVFVDFDNFFKTKHGSATLKNLEHELSKASSWIARRWPEIRNIDLRLCGGWLSNGIATKRASTVLQRIGNLNQSPFHRPGTRCFVRATVSAVTKLEHLLDLEWPISYRAERGFQRIFS